MEAPLQEPLVVAVVAGFVAVVFARVGVVVRTDAAGAGVARAGKAGKAGTAGTGAGGGPAVSISIVWALLSQVALLSWLRPL